MNKREIAEIKKQFDIKRCNIDRIYTCYVNAEKEQCAIMHGRFLELPEEEIFKYLAMFKKSLGGGLDKNLLNLEIEKEEWGCKERLLDTRNSHLKDKSMVQELLEKIIEAYIYDGNYYIVLIHGIYDIPGRTSDNQEMEDASEEIYEYIMCCICPVKLSKAGLSYKENLNRIENRDRDWVVGAPEHAFLYPAFNKRTQDIDRCLYYSNKMNACQPDFAKKILGCTIKWTPEEEKEIFESILYDALEEKCTLENLTEINESIKEIKEECECRSARFVIEKETMKKLIDRLDSSKAERFDDIWDGRIGKCNVLHGNNLLVKDEARIEFQYGRIKIAEEYLWNIRMERDAGVTNIVIPVLNGAITINGVPVNV